MEVVGIDDIRLWRWRWMDTCHSRTKTLSGFTTFGFYFSRKFWFFGVAGNPSFGIGKSLFIVGIYSISQ